MRDLTTSLCPIMQAFISGVYPHMSLLFKSMLLINNYIMRHFDDISNTVTALQNKGVSSFNLHLFSCRVVFRTP